MYAKFEIPTVDMSVEFEFGSPYNMDPATAVNVYLKVNGSQLLFLSIPCRDVQRLSLRPFKWLRFVMFSICGARGDISATPDGPLVNYENISVDGTDYYYKHWEEFVFIDYHGLNDRITSSAYTACSNRFREEVMRRDGPVCVITQMSSVSCDAAHLIPKSKGDEYIQRVFQDRFMRYGPIPLISGINAVENGIFLTKSMHAMLGAGMVCFLKTPNFALDPADIQRVEQGPMPHYRITLQQLNLPEHPGMLDLVSPKDAEFHGTEGTLPPAIILDYIYGIAAYNLWKHVPVHNIMEKYYTEHYKSIPLPFAHSGSSSDHNSGVDSNNGDDHDPDYDPGLSHGQSHHVRKRNVLSETMDELNLLLMLLSGTTPEKRRLEWEKKMEEEELIAQKESQRKVMEWMLTMDDTGIKNSESESGPS